MMNTNLIINKISTGKTRGYMFKELEESISNNENLLITMQGKDGFAYPFWSHG